MQLYRFTEEELKTTLEKYPKLEQKSDGVLAGEIEINHQFGEVTLVDSFKISIEVDDKYPLSFPRLYETGGRTKAIADKYDIKDYRDLHCYASREAGAACVCAIQEQRRKFPKGSDIVVYIDSLVIPYLYGLSYYDNFKKWPWGERSHGVMGLLEAYADINGPTLEDVTQTLISIRTESEWTAFHKQLKNPNPSKSCPCSSGKAFGRCHSGAFVGLEKLSADAKKLGLNIKGLLDVIANRLKKQ